MPRPVTKRPRQPALFPAHAPIKADDGLDADTFMRQTTPLEAAPVLYKCRCGNRAELSILITAAVCVKCGCRMRPTP